MDEDNVLGITDRRSINAYAEEADESEEVNDAKVDESLGGMDTEEKRAETQKRINNAQQVWAAFKHAASSPIERPERRLIAAALMAFHDLLGADLAQLWANIGIAVQESRTAIKACLEMGSESLRLIRELERRVNDLAAAAAPAVGYPPLGSAPALEAALSRMEAVPAPKDLPDGSTRTDPVL